MRKLSLQGKRITLEKIADMPGRHSKGAIGRIQTLNLTEDIILGYTLMKKRVSRNRDEAPMSVPGTSGVTKIQCIDDINKIYQIETQSSVYKIKLLS